MTQLISLTGIRLTFGGTPLLEGAELSVQAGDRVCLVGRNGSGKTTLMRIAAGLADADKGMRFVLPSCRVRYLAQEIDLTGHATTMDYVTSGLEGADDTRLARQLIDELALDGSADPRGMSGGEARRAAVARVLAADPDVLLLDEPTNHLDLTAIEWLEGRLAASRAGIVLISHDRRMLETLSRSVVWLDRGKTRRLASGFAAFEAWRDKLMEEEQAERHKLDRKIEREEEWMHSGGVTARRKRNMRRVAELGELRRQRREARKAVGQVRMAASDGVRSGQLVIEARGVSKAFGSAPVVSDFSMTVMRGDRVGLVGPNGAGKTTLLRMLTGDLAPDVGEIRRGTNLEIVGLDQHRAALAPGARVSDVLTGGRGDFVEINGQRRHVAGYLSDFLFSSEQFRSPVEALSGGERARLLLARALARPSNLLVLDEPTNDLDIETLDLLQELLADYAGTLLLVSHDRDFLDRVVSSVVMAEGDGRWVEYAGGYTDMLAQRGRAAPSRRQLQRERRDGGAMAAETPKPIVAATDRSARKLSFKEKHALETLPAKIAELEAEIATLNAALSDSRSFGSDVARLTQASARLGQAQAELAAAEEQWLELELKRTEIGA